jgi:hypothetical protein
MMVGALAGWPLRAQEGPGGPPPPQAPFELVLSTTGLPAEGRWKSTPQLVDLNRDGLLDLVVHPRLGRQTHVWFGDGRGGWTDASEGLVIPKLSTCGGGVQAADVNRDGHLDLVVGDHCDGVHVLFGDSKGHWTLGRQAMNPAMSDKFKDDGENPYAGAEDVAVGDINGDGFPDIVAGGSDRGGFTIYLGDGSGTKWTETPPSGLPTLEAPDEGDADEGGWCRDVQLVDMNGDKHLDVLASYHRGPRVWLGDGKGTFTAASKGLPAPLLFGIFQQVEAFDVNRDGRLDIVASNTVNGPEVYLQNADGSWQSAIDVMPPMRGGSTAVAVGDLDGDGHADIVTAGKIGKNAQYGLFALRGDGRGAWTPVKTAMAEDKQQVVWGITLADVNGDKRLDVVATLGGAMGAGSEEAGKPATGPESGPVYPHIQVWLNQAR